MALLVPLLLLGGCGLQDCALAISHGDCLAAASPPTTFPQDDAICRSYGLEPGTRDYAKCRRAKHHVRALTGAETNDSYLRNPLLPDLR